MNKFDYFGWYGHFTHPQKDTDYQEVLEVYLVKGSSIVSGSQINPGSAKWC